jgi:hypothetical protein
MIATGSALIAGLLTLTTPSARAQGTFPLQCRGGGQVNMVYDSVATTVFVPGPAGNGLAPGQCSWLDRAFRSGEPWQICSRDITKAKFFWAPGGRYTVWFPEAEYVYNLLYDQFLVTVNVYNEGQCMHVVR